MLRIQSTTIGHLGLACGPGDAADQAVRDLGAAWAGLATDRRSDSVRGNGVQPFGVVQVLIGPGNQQDIAADSGIGVEVVPVTWRHPDVVRPGATGRGPTCGRQFRSGRWAVQVHGDDPGHGYHVGAPLGLVENLVPLDLHNRWSPEVLPDPVHPRWAWLGCRSVAVRSHETGPCQRRSIRRGDGVTDGSV